MVSRGNYDILALRGIAPDRIYPVSLGEQENTPDAVSFPERRLTQTRGQGRIEAAERLLAEGKSAAALAELEDVAPQNANDPEVDTLRGRALSQMGRPQDALGYFDHVIQEHAEHTDAHVGAGIAWLQLSDLDGEALERAGKHFERALSIDPTRADALVLWGKTLVLQGRPDQARWRFDQAAKAGAGADALLEAGKILRTQHQFDDAIDRLKRAVELEPDFVPAWVEWGLALEEIDDLESALEKYGEALKRDANAQQALAGSARVLVTLEQPKDALEFLDRARAQMTEPTPLFAIRLTLTSAEALSALERHDEACEELTAAIDQLDQLDADLRRRNVEAELTEARAQILLARAGTNVQLRRLDSAIADAKEAGRIDSSQAVHATWLAGLIYRDRGDYRSQWREFNAVPSKVEHEASSEVEPAPEAVRALAATLQALGRYEDAAREWSSAVKRWPDRPEFWIGLMGVALERYESAPPRTSEGRSDRETGWYWGARSAATRAKELLTERLKRRETAETALALADIHLAFEEFTDAEPLIAKALELDPASPTAHANLGLMESGMRRYSEALRAFEAAKARAPDDLVLRLQVAETNLLLGLLDDAETQYRSILREAPNTIEAHIGLAETLTRAAEDDEDRYVDAIRQLDAAEHLATLMRGSEVNWCASSHPSPRQLAGLKYMRGYARVQLYEARLRDTIVATRGHGRLLTRAEEDFREAFRLDPSHFKAKRAREKVAAAKRLFSGRGRGEIVAMAMVVALALLTFGLAQAVFLTGWPKEPSFAEWSALTLALLAFVVAGLSLPRLLKLKVAGVELERAAVEPLTDAAAVIAIRSVAIPRQRQRFDPFVGEEPRHPKQRETSSGSEQAQVGADVGPSGPEKQ